MEPQGSLPHNLLLFLRHRGGADLLAAALLILGGIVKIGAALGNDLHRRQIAVPQDPHSNIPAEELLFHDHMAAVAQGIPQRLSQFLSGVRQRHAQRRSSIDDLYRAGHRQLLRQPGDVLLLINEFPPGRRQDPHPLHHLLGHRFVHGHAGGQIAGAGVGNPQ